MIMRKAMLADAPLLLSWYNDPTVRSVSSDPSTRELDEYCDWLKQYLVSDTALRQGVYVFEACGEPIGVGRIEVDFDSASNVIDCCKISYALGRENRGKGFGKQLVAMLCEEARNVGYDRIVARIKKCNVKSVFCAVNGGVDTIHFF